MVGADETTELWRPQKIYFYYYYSIIICLFALINVSLNKVCRQMIRSSHMRQPCTCQTALDVAIHPVRAIDLHVSCTATIVTASWNKQCPILQKSCPNSRPSCIYLKEMFSKQLQIQRLNFFCKKICQFNLSRKPNMVTLQLTRVTTHNAVGPQHLQLKRNLPTYW